MALPSTAGPSRPSRDGQVGAFTKLFRRGSAAMAAPRMFWRTTMDEASLIAAAKVGEERAFETLLAQYSALINAICEPFFLPGSDGADLLQEACFGFFKGVRDFKLEGGSFRSFAELAVRRNVITALKCSTRQKHRTLNAALSLDAPLNNDEAVTRTLVDVLSLAPETERDEQLTQVVRDAIVDGACLSDFEAHVCLANLKGATYAYMAQSLGKSTKAVDNAMQRIKRKTDRALREAIAAHLATPVRVQLSLALAVFRAWKG